MFIIGNIPNLTLTEQKSYQKEKNLLRGLIHLSLLTVLILSFCIPMVTYIYSSRAKEITSQTVSSIEQKNYTREALIYQWRSQRNYIVPAILLTTARMEKAGSNKKEITKVITQMRKKYKDNIRVGHLRDWQIDETYKSMIRNLGGAIGGVATAGIPGISNTTSNLGAITADAMILAYETSNRDKKINAASAQLGFTHLKIREIEKIAADEFLQSYSNSEITRKIYDEQLYTVFGFNPTDGGDKIIKQIPAFNEYHTTLEIARSLKQQKLTDKKNSQVLSETVQSVLNNMRTIRKQQNKKAKAEKNKERSRLENEGMRATAYIAATAIGLVDPVMGRYVEGLTSTAIQIREARSIFDSATETLGKDMTGAAGLKLMSGYVAAAMTLTNLFLETDPPPEKFILDEIFELRKDFRNLRVEMHDRFGIVDRKLRSIAAQLDQGFDDLSLTLRGHTKKLNVISNTLYKLQNEISLGDSLLREQNNAVRNLITNLAINKCTNRKRYGQETMSYNEHYECVSHIMTVASPKQLKGLQIITNKRNLKYAGLLRTEPNKMMTTSMRSMKNLNQPAVRESSVHFGLMHWQTIAQEFFKFLDNWPIQTAKRLEKAGNTFAIDLSEVSKNTISSRSLAQKELRSFANGKNYGALENLFKRVEQRKQVLEGLIISEKRKYFDLKLLKFKPKIAAMNDKVLCNFHSKGKHNALYDGSGYVARLPDEVADKLHFDIKKLVFLDIGELEYCLEIFYRRRVKIKYGSLELAPESTGEQATPSSAADNAIRILNAGDRLFYRAPSMRSLNGKFLLADTGRETIQYLGGPLTTILKIYFKEKSLSCPKNGSKERLIKILDAVVVDRSKFSPGNWKRFKNGPLLIAAEQIWNSKRHEFFAKASFLDMTDHIENCILTVLGSRLENQWIKSESRWILDRLTEGTAVDIRKLLLADEKTEFDYALLSHWIWIGFGEAAKENRLLARLISGEAVGPTLASALAATEIRKDALVSDAPVEFVKKLNEIKSVLRLPLMRKLFAGNFDNFRLKKIDERIQKLTNGD